MTNVGSASQALQSVDPSLIPFSLTIFHELLQTLSFVSTAHCVDHHACLLRLCVFGVCRTREEREKKEREEKRERRVVSL